MGASYNKNVTAGGEPNTISTANSTTALLGAGATFTGAWEDVTGYTTVATAILGSVVTDGTLYFDLSTDGGSTFTSVPSIISDTTFAVPRILNVVETHVRIRYTNGTTAQTGTWSLQTKYSNGQELALLGAVNGFINDETPVNPTRAVSVGKNPNSSYINVPAPGIVNDLSTTSTLGISGVWTSAWHNVELYGEIKCAMTADVESTSCLLQLSHDGITVDTSLSLPPQLNGGGNYTFIHALNPSLPYFRIVYTNGAVAQTTFKFKTTLLVQSGNGFVSRATQVLDRHTDVKTVRTVNSPDDDINAGLINYQSAGRKFGKNSSVANASFETLWEGAHIDAVLTYTFPTTAETIRIRAGGNAADDTAGTGARTIIVQGLDSNWEEISETITTAGASASAATTATFYRVNKVYIETAGAYGGNNAGDIIIENTTSTQALAYVAAGIGNTQQCVYTVPAGKTAYLNLIKVSVGLSDSADIRIFHIDAADDFSTPYTSVKHFEWGLEDYSGSNTFLKRTFLKFDEKNDIIADAKRITGSGTARVSLDFDFKLVDNA